jgi:hypothetical protein
LGILKFLDTPLSCGSGRPLAPFLRDWLNGSSSNASSNDFERLVLGLSDLIEFCDVFLLILLERKGEGCLGLPRGVFLAFLGEGDSDALVPVVLIEVCDLFERLVLGLSDLIEFCDVFLLILLERNGEGCLGLPSGVFLAFLGEGDFDLPV